MNENRVSKASKAHRLRRRGVLLACPVAGRLTFSATSSACVGLHHPEIHFDVRRHRYRLPILGPRFELPLADGVHRILIQAKPQSLQHTDIVRQSVSSTLDRDHYAARQPHDSSFVAILRFHLLQYPSISHVSADPIDLPGLSLHLPPTRLPHR